VTQSRKDLFQAHRLMTQRAALALLRGEPDLPDQPMRRLNVATFAGTLTAVIIGSLIAILTVLGHGGQPASPGPGSLLIDSQTGTPYVFCLRGRLCPVLNYASARLALHSTSVSQQTLDQRALTRYQRGPLIGIPGLPQPLPAPALLVRQPWSVCLRTVLTPAGQRVVTTMAAGTSTGGRALTAGALLMRAGGSDWMIWHGQRMVVQQAMVAALFTAKRPLPAPAAWLDALPEGPPLAPPPVSGFGAAVPGPAGTSARVGQVFQVRAAAGSPARYYVMLRGGLAHISQTQAVLLEYQPGAPRPRTLSPSQVSGDLSAAVVRQRGLPGHLPAIAGTSPATTLCVVFTGTAGSPVLARQVMTGGHLPAGGAPSQAASGPGVDQITLPPGAGALVGAVPGNGRAGSAISYFLVAGGRRYGLASKNVAAMLGYDLARQAVLLPASVVRDIPQGPALDPAAAARPVTQGG
jgi:ESX secretion system ATPase EccB